MVRLSDSPKFLQLKRAQLRDLITSLQTQPSFYWLNGPTAPIGWNEGGLSGVSVFLRPAAAALPKTESRSSTPPQATPHSSQSRNRAEVGRLTVDGSEHYLAITLPSRESFAYNPALELVKTAGFTLDPSTRRWWLRDRHKTLNFLATHGARLREHLDADFTPNFEKNTSHLREAEVVCDATEARTGFNLTVALKAGRADEGQIRSAVSSNRGYIEDDGKVYLLAPEKLQKLDATQRALAGDAPGSSGLTTRRTHSVSAARAVAAQELLEEIARISNLLPLGKHELTRCEIYRPWSPRRLPQLLRLSYVPIKNSGLPGCVIFSATNWAESSRTKWVSAKLSRHSACSVSYIQEPEIA